MLLLSAVLGALSCAAPEDRYSTPAVTYDPQECVETALRHGVGAAEMEKSHFETACQRGDPSACSVLGVMAQQGDATPVRALRAMMLYERACRAGNQRACMNLAEMY